MSGPGHGRNGQRHPIRQIPQPAAFPVRLQCSYNIIRISTLSLNGMMPTSITLLAIGFLQTRPSRSLKTIPSTLRLNHWAGRNVPRASAARIEAGSSWW